MTARPAFSATASLLHNNLVSSPSGSLCSVHNSVNAGCGKLMMFGCPSAPNSCTQGPEANQVTSVRFLDLGSCVVLCVSSTNGTQIYNEDATQLFFFAPVTDTATEVDVLKHHRGACVVPELQHIVIGTSKGSLTLVNVSSGSFVPAPESLPAQLTTEVSDVCFSAAANMVVSAHSNGELRTWQLSATGPYLNGLSMPPSLPNSQAPVRIASLTPSAQIMVAYGPGTICLYDAFSLELQVELSAHARWINGVDVREDMGIFASVGEDTVLNVWQVEPTKRQVCLLKTTPVVDKLLTGVAFRGAAMAGVAVTAYDSEVIYEVALQ